MKIVICGSMRVSSDMLEVASRLRGAGHEVVLPRHTKEYAKMGTSEEIYNESAKNKIEEDLIRDYYNVIKDNDAVLVINNNLKNISGYIGGNSFLEMGFAHVLNKKIFLLNDIPDISFKDELVAMQPIILNGELNKIE